MERFLLFVENTRDKMPEELYYQIKRTRDYKTTVIYNPYLTLFFKGTTPHREGGPAEIMYYGSGHIFCQKWYKEGKIHREDGPAQIWYYKSGKFLCKEWYRDGKRHREYGPAEVYYESITGHIYSMKWYKDGNL